MTKFCLVREENVTDNAIFLENQPDFVNTFITFIKGYGIKWKFIGNLQAQKFYVKYFTIVQTKINSANQNMPIKNSIKLDIVS